MTMMKKLLLALSTVALSAAAAADTYRVTLFQPSVIGGATLKPGDYKVEVTGNRAVIKGNGARVEADVKVAPAEQKFPSTSVRYSNGDGAMKVEEIRLGGTKTRLVFDSPDSRPAGE
jgi:hypothetical protein